MCKNLWFISVLLLLVSITTIVSAVTLSPIDDAYISEQSHGSNYGSQNFLMLGHSAFLINTLIKFDLSAYTGETIESAELRLYVYYISTTTDQIIARNTEDWSEDTVTWDTKPGTTYESSISGPSIEDEYWVIDVTDLVQGFLSGAYMNYGFQMTKDAPLDGFLYIFSKEYSSTHPELVLTFPSNLEPATLGEIKSTFD